MTRSAFLGIFVFVFILAAPGLVSAARETVSPPDNLTDMQKNEWEIGAYSGWLQLCGYRSKSSQISSFMKKSPYFRKGETEMLKFDAGAGCTSSNERLNELLRDKDQWERYLDDTYTPQPKLSVGPYDGLWTGLGESEGGNCKYLGLGRSFFAFELEIMVREQEIKGRIKGLRTFNWRHFFADVSIQGTVSEN